MKKVLSVVIVILTFIGFFFLDKLFVDWIVQSLPETMSQWIPLIKFVSWVTLLIITIFLTFIVSVFFTVITQILK
jgi:hypothetical protein